MSFIFIGGGIYSHLLEAMDAKHETFTYLGFRDSEQATKICSQYSWALLPIEDEVTRFAFPSKTSTYLISNSNISCDLRKRNQRRKMGAFEPFRINSRA